MRLFRINKACQGSSLEYLRWLKAEFSEVWLSRLTTSQFEKMYLRPRTCRLRCSVVDALAADAAAAHQVGPATWFVSHTWNNAFADTLDAIFQFFEGREDAAHAVLWLDVFVDSQHVSEGPSKTPQWYMNTFRSSIARIGSLLLVVDAWDNPTPLKRAWYAAARPHLCRQEREWLIIFLLQVRTGTARDCGEEGWGRRRLCRGNDGSGEAAFSRRNQQGSW